MSIEERDAADHPIPEKEMPDEPPPVLGSWRNVYLFVIGYLATIITLFYIFTRVMA